MDNSPLSQAFATIQILATKLTNIDRVKVTLTLKASLHTT